MAAGVDHVYSYAHSSGIEMLQGRPRIRLATSGGVEEHPYFFEGRLSDPRRATMLLRAVAHVAMSRFYVPPAMQARIIRERDPVVTCGGERLRFESFSQCCGVYCRLDLLPAAFTGELRGRGTTNVEGSQVRPAPGRGHQDRS